MMWKFRLALYTIWVFETLLLARDRISNITRVASLL